MDGMKGLFVESLFMINLTGTTTTLKTEAALREIESL